MHLGLGFFATDLTTDVRDVARAAEDAGFESLFVAEHSHIPISRETPYPMGGDLPESYSHTMDPFVTLATVAAVTERIRIGTGVCLPPERDPIIMAKEVATLDRLSGGRLMLGVGTGWNAEEMADHGVAFADRWDVMADRVQLMQSLWSNEVGSYDGKHARLSPSWQWPKPMQTPMPVLVAGSSKRAMRDAVGYGTGWMPMPSKQPLDERLAELAQYAADSGKPVPEVTMYWVRPDAGVLAHYASKGIARAVILLPFHGDVLPALHELAGLVEK
jgi:probable F420-dependent oxidoreductase